MEIYNLKDNIKYLNEVATLEYEEWANNKEQNRTERIKKNIEEKDIQKL